MMRHTLRAVAFVAVLVLAGCGRGKVKIEEILEDQDTRLSHTSDIDVSRWLRLPRAELAKRADEADDALDQQREAFRNRPTNEVLLPRLNAPRTVPVFRKAKYSAKRGFSLPDYVKDGQPDSAVAIHLAKFGDHEAASKLIGEDANARTALAAFAASKNYSVEWIRLVGLTLIVAQNKLALGDVEGASEIVHIHAQLAKLLDAKAPEALRAALLPVGRRALVQASKAFTGPNYKKTALAADLEKAVADWGQSPTPASVLGTPAVLAAAQFGKPAVGKALVSADLDRARDLLGLPLPTEAVQSVVAFLDDDRVSEISLVYRGKLDSTYPESDHLGYHLDEAGIAGKDEGKLAGVSKWSYQAGKDRYEISRTRSPGLGALVRLRTDKPFQARNLRELGPVNFDRGFEANRIGWVPTLAGPIVAIEDKAALKLLVGSSSVQPPTLAALRRHTGEDLVAGLSLSWPAEANLHAAAQLVPSLAHFGPATLEGVEDSAGSFLRLYWQDDRTRAELRLPYDDKGPILIVEDTQPASATAQRLKAVQQKDEQERANRLREGKPSERLARSPGTVNDFSLEALKLGQSRAEAETLLPNGKLYRVKAISDGVSLIVAVPPGDRATHWATQVMLRYAEEKVSEIRIRYREGLIATRSGESLKDRLSQGKAGEPEELPSTWAGVWGDLPATAPKPALFRWQDDRTVCTYQRDAGGSEVTWRDRDATPTLWRFAGQGPKDISLGDTREAVEAKYTRASTSAGAAVYRSADKGPHEMFLVWYAKDRVERIVAVHRDRAGTQTDEANRSLQLVWGQNLEWGSVRRQEGRLGSILASYYWHDDAIRISTFAQLDDGAARVLTEWRALPIAAATTTAKR